MLLDMEDGYSGAVGAMNPMEINWKDIRCKLDSLVLEPHCICKCKSHRRLADSRYIVHENVTACDYRRHYLGNTHILA